MDGEQVAVEEVEAVVVEVVDVEALEEEEGLAKTPKIHYND